MKYKYTLTTISQSGKFLSRTVLQLSFLFFLSFMAFLPTVQAEECEASDNCMDFAFIEKVDNGNGSTTLCFSITNNCNRALSYAAFSVPQEASSPSDNSVYASDNGINYKIENTTNNPFYSIKFETIGEGFKNGGSGEFCFDLPTAIADDFSTITIQSKASNKTYQVTIDFSTCSDPVCDNIPLFQGGAAGVRSIGTNFPSSIATVCEGMPFVIENVLSPTGGSGALETAWIKCSGGVGAEDCGSRFEELGPLNVGQIYTDFVANGGSGRIGNTCWEFATDGDADDLSLNIDGIYSTTCFVRCVRRAGCEAFTGEGNIITVQVTSCSSPRQGQLIEDNADFAVYPNPAYDEISVLPAEKYFGQSWTIIVYNQLGNVMLQKEIDQVEDHSIRLNTSLFPGGVYTIYFKVGEQKSIGKKLVISRL
ncbi:MAG: putative membrane protein [Saprospiraceae bacterium]|jgi:uncharacterized membrane protein